MTSTIKRQEVNRMDPYIEIKDAVKQFKETTALDHVNLSFEQGKIHGIIGRNGSGKTVL